MRTLLVILCLFFSVFCFGNGGGIVGGDSTTIDEVPYLVSIGTFDDSLMVYDHGCGGSIINEYWIISAGHCNQMVGDYIHAGATDVTDVTVGQLIEVDSIIYHPLYDGNVDPDLYDVCLLRLKNPLIFDANVKPIKIWDGYSTIPEGTEVKICGWGEDSNVGPNPLLSATLQYLSLEEAQNLLVGTTCETYVHSSMVAYQDSIAAQGVGDSGGPAVVKIEGEDIMIGPISWNCGAPGQGLIATEYPDFSANPSWSHCHGDNTRLTGEIAGPHDGSFYIDGTVNINSSLSLTGTVYMYENSQININSGAIVNFDSLDLIACDTQLKWKGIKINSGASGVFNNVRILGAEKGIETAESAVDLVDVAIRDCDLGLEIQGANSNEFLMRFMRFINSPVYFEQATIRMKGCKFSESPLDINGSEVRILPFLEGDMITETRCAFYGSPTDFDGGSKYSVGWAYYDDNSFIDIDDCGFVNICWSKYDKTEKPTLLSSIVINSTDKHHIFGNIFDGVSKSVFIQSDSSSRSNKSQFRNNVNINNAGEAFVSASDPNIEFWCNHHDDNFRAYLTPANMVDQGYDNQPAGNLFNKTSQSVDIGNVDGFEYYWEENNLSTYPEVLNSNGFIRIETEPIADIKLGCGGSTGSRCCTREFITAVWDGDLCPPETWWDINSDCYSTCGACWYCEPILDPESEPGPGEGGGVGRWVSEGNNFAQDFGHDVEDLINANEILPILDDSEFQYYLFDINGRLHKNVSRKWDEIPSGIYFLTILDENHQILRQQKLFIP